MEKKRILLVDDDPNVLKALVRVLHDEPYEVETAESAIEAKVKMERQKFCLIISDVVMPVTSGYELLAWVRTNHPYIVRTMLTGKADLKSVMRAINEGEIYRFFTKPWDPIELKLSIRLGIEKFDLENERKILLSVVQQQRDELVRIEEECPGISKVKRDTADAILVDEMSEEQMAEIKKWWVNN